MSKDEFLFLPLGGAGEIGMNLSLYGFRGKWLMVDLGVSFGDDTTPGVDVVVPDISFLDEIRHQLAGLVLTHAHEDHLGAVHHLWHRLGCPVYATPFACGLLRRKLAEAGIEGEVPLFEVPCGGGVDLDPFRVDYIPVAHSIPEAHALAIRTAAGTVLHVSDWKLDPGPVIGPVTDEDALRRLGDGGVIAMMSDSTNIFVAGRSGSEAALDASLTQLIGRCRGRVAVASFASNVARLQTITGAAVANGRNVALVGRSLRNMNAIARENGYLSKLEPFLAEQDVGYLPRDKVLMAVTGSQGEPRAALAQIATDSHPRVALEKGDTVIFSSRVIPGNEKAIGRVQNELARRGIEVITEDDHFVHVSGHPARDEIAHMYDLLRPALVVPIHGETRHLAEQARFAEACQVPATAVAENGSILRLHPGPAEIVDQVTTGRYAVDGKRMLRLDGAVLRTRRRIGYGGAAVATLVLDRKGKFREDPQLAIPGLLDGGMEDDEAHLAAIDAIMDAVEDLSPKARKDDEQVVEAARRAVRRAMYDTIGRRPVTQIHLVRV